MTKAQLRAKKTQLVKELRLRVKEFLKDCKDLRDAKTRVEEARKNISGLKKEIGMLTVSIGIDLVA